MADHRPPVEARRRGGACRRRAEPFWNYIELFYRNQGEENSGYVTDDFLTEIAKGAGVPDLSKWDSDRKSAKFDSQFASIARQANAMGFTGTPTIYVQGPGRQEGFARRPDSVGGRGGDQVRLQ